MLFVLDALCSTAKRFFIYPKHFDKGYRLDHKRLDDISSQLELPLILSILAEDN